MADKKRGVLLVGHFPPPVHGMAMAMSALANLFGELGTVICVRTVPSRSAVGLAYHLGRVRLVGAAAIRLVVLRPRSRVVFLSVDAGKGMLYVTALTWVARRLGFRVLLQHHSYAYISRFSRLMSLLVRIAGSSTCHLHSCQSACDDFRRLYARACMTRAVSVAYALEEPSGVRAISAQVAVPRRLTIGHLSNLTVDKGLGEVIRFGRAALARGQVERVILAGPAMGDVEQALIRAVLAEPGFEYWGFVAGQRREAFFMDIDLFLFPSRYKNESYGLVAWEAMLRGVPVIAYRAGCLTQAAAGPSNTILEPSEDFTATALSRVEELCGSSARLAEDSAAVATVAREERARARSDVIQLGIELFGLTGARTLN